jgi:hypothetical protein
VAPLANPLKQVSGDSPCGKEPSSEALIRINSTLQSCLQPCSNQAQTTHHGAPTLLLILPTAADACVLTEALDLHAMGNTPPNVLHIHRELRIRRMPCCRSLAQQQLLARDQLSTIVPQLPKAGMGKHNPITVQTQVKPGRRQDIGRYHVVCGPCPS